jgi:transaldolase
MKSQLEALKDFTVVVADSSDFASISTFTPQDATTNPSLIQSAANLELYAPLINEAVYYGKKSANALSSALDRVFINFGREILKIIPGRVSIEVDSRLSFDTQKSLEKAEHLIALFEKEGIDRERILIKLASTWEGMAAAKELEKKKIHCNMTLLFCLTQAVAAADAKATLISPFVGRILDWYKKNKGNKSYLPHLDPGVVSISKIFHYYKKFGLKTQIMGASFRNIEEILELAGCDFLTIAPKFLQQLQTSKEPVIQKLDSRISQSLAIEKITLDRAKFLHALDRDAMAKEKLLEGIQNFNKDMILLENFLKEKL